MRALVALIALIGCSPSPAPLPDAGPGDDPRPDLSPLGPVGCIGCGGLPQNPSCTGQSDDVIQMVSSPVSGNALGLHADTEALCGWLTGTQADVELRLQLPELLTFRAHLTQGGSFTEGSLRLGRCGGGFLGWGSCDSNVFNGDARWELNHVPAGNYYLVVYPDPIQPAEPYTVTVNGVIMPNARCDVPLALAGALTCAPGTGCNGSRCVSAGGACGDGVDNDGDGKNGYPWDPGCSSVTDPSELDDCPSGPGCAACANLLDEDGDGFAGYPTDPGCASPGDLDESDECQDNPLNCPQCANQFDDDFDDKWDLDDPSCGFAGWDDESPED